MLFIYHEDGEKIAPNMFALRILMRFRRGVVRYGLRCHTTPPTAFWKRWHFDVGHGLRIIFLRSRQNWLLAKRRSEPSGSNRAGPWVACRIKYSATESALVARKLSLSVSRYLSWRTCVHRATRSPRLASLLLYADPICRRDSLGLFSILRLSRFGERKSKPKATALCASELRFIRTRCVALRCVTLRCGAASAVGGKNDATCVRCRNATHAPHSVNESLRQDRAYAVRTTKTFQYSTA